MDQDYIKGQVLEKVDFTQSPLAKAEYEKCSFTSCNFSQTDLSGCIFVDCVFTNCNLSLIVVKKTIFRNIVFDGCKMLGIQFGNSSAFALSFSFDNCILNHSSFYKLKLKIKFKNSTLEEVDFALCDLSGTVFENCDLKRATFDNTTLEKTDFRSAYNYSIDPEINHVRKAKFSLTGLPGLLDKYDIEIEL